MVKNESVKWKGESGRQRHSSISLPRTSRLWQAAPLSPHDLQFSMLPTAKPKSDAKAPDTSIFIVLDEKTTTDDTASSINFSRSPLSLELELPAPTPHSNLSSLSALLGSHSPLTDNGNMVLSEDDI